MPRIVWSHYRVFFLWLLTNMRVIAAHGEWAWHNILKSTVCLFGMMLLFHLKTTLTSKRDTTPASFIPGYQCASLPAKWLNSIVTRHIEAFVVIQSFKQIPSRLIHSFRTTGLRSFSQTGCSYLNVFINLESKNFLAYWRSIEVMLLPRRPWSWPFLMIAETKLLCGLIFSVRASMISAKGYIDTYIHHTNSFTETYRSIAPFSLDLL